MINFIKNLFRNRNVHCDPIADDKFYLSIQMNREEKSHINKMNLFIDKMKEQKIDWEYYVNQPMMLIDKYDNKFIPFNVCVDIENRSKLEQIHKEVYNFDLKK